MNNLKAIAAVSLNGVIGKKGDLPWRLPEDLKWFKKITFGHPILMGRKTWASLGRPLPGRKNLVLSRSMYPETGAKVIRSINELNQEVKGVETFLIGGGELYAQFLPLCEELFLTTVLREIEGGDAFFPEYESLFESAETLEENEEFVLRKWVRKAS